uniref:WW domain-containing protein n=1 Tax=Steinernema glaseri TaxID=37863 RepID=A0A1I7Z1C8_9BILA
MDRVPYLFVNAVLHCMNSESLSAPRLLAHPLWSSVAEEHYQKRKDYAFRLCCYLTGEFQLFVDRIGEYTYFAAEEWLKSDRTHLRVRKLIFSSERSKYVPYKTIDEAVQCALRMESYLNNLDDINIFFFVLTNKKGRFDFLWKRPCRNLTLADVEINVLRWHIENNDRLKSIDTHLLSYDEVRDLIHLCAKKQLTWEMRFGLTPNTLNSVKTWQGDAQWDEIYPTLTNDNTYVVPAQPERGRAFYEDEHMRKEFLWESDGGSSLTITWK